MNNALAMLAAMGASLPTDQSRPGVGPQKDRGSYDPRAAKALRRRRSKNKAAKKMRKRNRS